MLRFSLRAALCFFLSLTQVSAQSIAVAPEKANATAKPSLKAKTVNPFEDGQQVLEAAQAFHKKEEAQSRLRLSEEGYKAPSLATVNATSAPLPPQSAPATPTR